MNKSLFTLIICLLTCISPLKAHEEDSPLEEQMKILARGTKQLSQQIDTPTNQQSSIDLIENLKKAVKVSESLEPRKIVSIPQSDREKFLAQYHAEMKKLFDLLNKIEVELKGGNYATAKNLFASIKPMEKEGHKQFKED
jgi:hypothetical protein